MATPIDPEIMARLQAQGWLDNSKPAGGPVAPPPMAHADPAANYDTSPGIGQQSSREAAIRQMISSPITPKPETPGGPGGGRAEGVFTNGPGGEPGGAPETPQWKMPPMKATPGKWGSTVSPGVRGEYDTAMTARAGAPNEEALAQDVANQQMAGVYDQQAEALGKQMFAQDAARRKRTEALDAQMGDYKRLQDEAANQKEDPGRWWGSKSAGEKMLGAIGIILGGLSAGQGKGNPAMELMNKSIDQDIASQKANMAQKQKGADAALNIYSQKVRQFGDEDAADMATRAQMLEQFKLQTQSEALRSQSPVLQARAKELGAQIQLEQAKLHQGLEAWQKGGVAGGITPEDQKRAFELYKSGQAVSMDKAIQAALALRGVATTQGLPVLDKSRAAAGKGGTKEDLANAELMESSKNPPKALDTWDRVTAGLSHVPGIGRAFQGTEGARKEVAIEAGNTPVLGFAHKGLGARTYEAQLHMAGALLPETGDSQERINQKYALRALVARGGMDAAEAVKKLGGGGGGAAKLSESGSGPDKEEE